MDIKIKLDKSSVTFGVTKKISDNISVGGTAKIGTDPANFKSIKAKVIVTIPWKK